MIELGIATDIKAFFYNVLNQDLTEQFTEPLNTVLEQVSRMISSVLPDNLERDFVLMLRSVSPMLPSMLTNDVLDGLYQSHDFPAAVKELFPFLSSEVKKLDIGTSLDSILDTGSGIEDESEVPLDPALRQALESQKSKKKVSGTAGIGASAEEASTRLGTGVQNVFTFGSPPTINFEVMKAQKDMVVVIHITFVVVIAAIGAVIETLTGGQIDKFLDSLSTIYSLSIFPTLYSQYQAIEAETAFVRPYRYAQEAANLTQIPSPQDLIMFLVREQLGDNADEAVAQFTKLMGYMGFHPFWAMAYWNSHWRLPETSQLYEMYGRGIITEETLVKQLIVNDIHPDWVGRMVDLSRRIPSRTEARLINRTRKMSSDKMQRILRAERIHPEFEEDYRFFLENQELDTLQLRQIDEIAEQFRKGYISEDDFREFLSGTVYSDQEVDTRVDIEYNRRMTDLLDDKVQALKLAFRKNLIASVEEFDSLLSEYILDAEIRALIIDTEAFRKGLPADLEDEKGG